MNDTPVTRQNALSDADLVADCRERSNQARLDLADVKAEGVAAADLDAFDAEATVFEKTPGDADFLYAQQAKREERDTVLEAARSVLRDVLGPIRRAYGDTSPQYKRFDASRLSDASVPDILNLLTDAASTGSSYLTDTKALKEGFNQARINALMPAHAALQAAETTFKNATQTRLEGTRARTLAYNALDTRCAQLCARCHDYYVERNATKAHAYVRNPAPGAGAGAPAAAGV